MEDVGGEGGLMGVAAGTGGAVERTEEGMGEGMAGGGE